MGFLYSIYGLRMSSFVQEHQVFLKAVEKEIEGAKACSVPTLLLPEITQPALPNPTGPGRPNPKLLANDPRKGKSQWAYEEKKFLVHHLWIEAVHNLQQKIYSKKNTPNTDQRTSKFLLLSFGKSNKTVCDPDGTLMVVESKPLRVHPNWVFELLHI